MTAIIEWLGDLVTFYPGMMRDSVSLLCPALVVLAIPMIWVSVQADSQKEENNKAGDTRRCTKHK